MRGGFRVATWEETLEYGARLPRGLRPRIAGGALQTLAPDASTPALKQAGTVATAVAAAVSTAFSPPAGSGIAVLVGNGVNNTASVSSITDSLGSHLSYSLLKRSALASGAAEIWWANCPAAQTGMTVTTTLTAAIDGRDYAIGIIVFTGAALTQNGATQATGNTAGTPTGSLTTLRKGSRVISFLTNFSNATAPTVGASQTTTFGSTALFLPVAATGDGFWAQTTTADTPGDGVSVTLNDTAPTPINYAMAMVEILAMSNSRQAGAQQATMQAATR